MRRPAGADFSAVPNIGASPLYPGIIRADEDLIGGGIDSAFSGECFPGQARPRDVYSQRIFQVFAS